jgi:hypothetical protein
VKLAKLVRTFLISLLFSIVIPGALLFVLVWVSEGSGSGGEFDLPNLPQFLILRVIGVLALPFIIGTLVFGLPIAALIEANNLLIFSDVVLPLRYGTLTISRNTATAEIVGLIVQVLAWTIILFGIERLKQVKSNRKDFEAFLAAVPDIAPIEEDRLD